MATILCREEIVVVGGSTKVRDGMPEKDFTKALIILKGRAGCFFALGREGELSQ